MGVILNPPRPLPESWDDRRMYASALEAVETRLTRVINRLPGPPVSNDTALVTLLENNVIVGIGTADAALAAQTRFDLAWVSSNGLFRSIN